MSWIPLATLKWATIIIGHFDPTLYEEMRAMHRGNSHCGHLLTRLHCIIITYA